MEPFTIADFQKQYPDDNACLAAIFQHRYGQLAKCEGCKAPTKFHRVKRRKCYACQVCGYQLHPLANTIFHKSDTSLKLWFYAIFLFANSKNGVSAKELERQLGVTYKTAWRMAKQIRLLFKVPRHKLHDEVEVDETYIGGRRIGGKRGRGAGGKTPVVGMVQRGGRVMARVVPNVKTQTLIPLVRRHVRPGSHIMTDEMSSYRHLRGWYTHSRVQHTLRIYAKGLTHTNTIEGFWSQLKRSLRGTYHAVSTKHLQSYVNEFAYRYSKRDWPTSLFFPMLARAVRPA